MPIIVDPDNLDRNEIIFGPDVAPGDVRKNSAYPVGVVVTGVYDPELPTGETVAGGGAGTGTFNDSFQGLFSSNGIIAGQILSIKSGEDAGHYPVIAVQSETALTVELPLNQGVRQSVWRDTTLVSGVYDIRAESGGAITEGFTEQAHYSFSKEEWRVDTETFADDDLIRHPFPYEPITREQFEIGGGTTHGLWDWHSDDSRERVRTGGWAIITGTTTSYEYPGVLTLGALDADSRVYFQQSGTHASPVEFILSGTVNQAILSFDAVNLDNRTFLKLFVRKKARTYAGSELSDIGVVTLESIVNRFPLTHVNDPAITADDAEIEGHDPWTNFTTTDTNTNGVTAAISATRGTLSSAGENFDVSGAAPGDVVEITLGTDDNGFFEIVSVDTATQLTVDTEEHGIFTGEGTLTFEIHSRFVFQSDGVTPFQGTDGVLTDVDSDTGTIASAAGGFAGQVAADDILRVTEDPSDYRGVYVIVSQDTDNQLTADTSDQNWTGSTALSSIDFDILQPGMYLQYKNLDLPMGATGNITFNDNGVLEDTIVRADGAWDTRNVKTGDILEADGSVSNDGCYTVAWASGSVAGLVATDVLVNEGPSGGITITGEELFKRIINSVTYAFHWRSIGNGAGLDDVFEFEQRENRDAANIDEGPNYGGDRPWDRGDVTDLLMTFASPTGQGQDLYLDDFDANDANNMSFLDACGTSRAPSFVAAGTITFNLNLQNDSDAIFVMFFADPDGTPANGDEFGTPGAIVVDDANDVDISGNVSAQPSVSFTFDYDGNIQGGRTPGEDADIVLVAIGLNTAQYVRLDGTITRATGQTFGLVSSLERNYST